MALDKLTLEDGTGSLLLETGDYLLLESATAAASILLLRLMEEGLFVHALLLAIMVWGGQ